MLNSLLLLQAFLSRGNIIFLPITFVIADQSYVSIYMLKAAYPSNPRHSYRVVPHTREINIKLNLSRTDEARASVISVHLRPAD